jgi:serine/threonine protein phosphatase PrpC
MLLYNENLKKDISFIIKKNECINLLDDKSDVFIKLEFISKSDDDITSILVPTDEYQELYENIEQMNKTYDKNLDAYLIGIYNIKKIKV